MIADLTPERVTLLRERFDALDALLATPDQWTKTVGARTAKGKPINPRDPQATCWCVLGGTFKVSRMTGKGRTSLAIHTDMLICLQDAIKHLGHSDTLIGEFNDDNDFPAIKRLIAEARALLPIKPVKAKTKKGGK